MCVCVCVCVCVCHVFGIVMSFHMSPSHQLRFPDLAPEMAAAVGARCRVCVCVCVWGSITALAALHLTNGLLLSACDGPGAAANASLL